MKPIIFLFFAALFTYSLLSGNRGKEEKKVVDFPSQPVILLDETKQIECVDSSIIIPSYLLTSTEGINIYMQANSLR